MKKIPALFHAVMLLFLLFLCPAAEGFSPVNLHSTTPTDLQTTTSPLLLAQNLDNDYSEAIIWYRQMAEQGQAEGQYYLGLMYALGKGLPRDYQKAAMWFRKAAEQGYADAQFDLGRLYAVGNGVEQDLVQAYVLITLAARQGHKKAIKTKNFMAIQMSPQEMQLAQELLARLLQKSQ